MSEPTTRSSSVPRVGAPVGYIVLTQQPDETWRDDWDGEVHADIEAGRAALRACDEAGWVCILTEAVRVEGSAAALREPA